MKRLIFLVGMVLLGLSMGCKKDDASTPMEIALQNEPPLSFDLLDIPDKATNVGLNPTLSWESAKNPKGSEVAYDLYLGREVNPTILIESGITSTSFEISKRLFVLNDYYWKVAARDAEEQISRSNVNKFTTRNLKFPENPITAAANFSARTSHSSVVFNDKLWVIGGYDGERKNDVWFSSNGIDWVEATNNAGFSPRSGHTAVVFDSKIWVIGGSEGFGADGDRNDVWYSTDGINWTEATLTNSFTARHSHTTVIFKNKIWVIGGLGDNRKNDVWNSSDGSNWNLVNESANFSERDTHSTVVFNDKMWIIGGFAIDGRNNEIWSSGDGINWTGNNRSTPFSKRHGHSATVFEDKIWVIAGWVSPNSRGRDIWYSSDGTNWAEVTPKASISKRYKHSSMAFDSKLWIIGGWDFPGRLNDVWASD